MTISETDISDWAFVFQQHSRRLKKGFELCNQAGHMIAEHHQLKEHVKCSAWYLMRAIGDDNDNDHSNWSQFPILNTTNLWCRLSLPKSRGTLRIV